MQTRRVHFLAACVEEIDELLLRGDAALLRRLVAAQPGVLGQFRYSDTVRAYRYAAESDAAGASTEPLVPLLAEEFGFPLERVHAPGSYTTPGGAFARTCRSADAATFRYVMDHAPPDHEQFKASGCIEFHEACIGGDLGMVQELAERYQITRLDFEGFPGFGGAAAADRAGMLRWLADSFVVTAAEVRANGCQVVRRACVFGAARAVRFLVRRYELTPADLGALGGYALAAARRSRCAALVRFLERYEAGEADGADDAVDEADDGADDEADGADDEAGDGADDEAGEGTSAGPLSPGAPAAGAPALSVDEIESMLAECGL